MDLEYIVHCYIFAMDLGYVVHCYIFVGDVEYIGHYYIFVKYLQYVGHFKKLLPNKSSNKNLHSALLYHIYLFQYLLLKRYCNSSVENAV
jgi:hypothetical protein